MTKYTPIPHNIRDNNQCLCCNLRSTHFDRGIWYTLCKECLEEKKLGPSKVRIPLVGQDYADW